MKRINVKSSSIKSIGYNTIFKVLEIEFIREAIYHYYDVSSDVVCELIFADSIGKYFDQNIKNNYKYESV
jgi:hypothetical protein